MKMRCDRGWPRTVRLAVCDAQPKSEGCADFLASHGSRIDGTLPVIDSVISVAVLLANDAIGKMLHHSLVNLYHSVIATAHARRPKNFSVRRIAIHLRQTAGKLGEVEQRNSVIASLQMWNAACSGKFTSCYLLRGSGGRVSLER